jgi:hypothetical protein
MFLREHKDGMSSPLCDVNVSMRTWTRRFGSELEMMLGLSYFYFV